VDPSSTALAGVVVVNELLQVRQEGCDTKAASHHQYALILVDGQVHSVRPAEHNDGVDGITPLGMVQQLTSEATAWLYQQIERALCRGSPRDDRERVGLGEGPEADGRDPQISVSGCLSLHRPCDAAAMACRKSSPQAIHPAER
jgi:hypothetical protein